MLIETVLDKIVDHNADVHACILASGSDVYHNLSGAYEVVDANGISDRAQNLLALTELLEDEQCDAGMAFVEYDDHSLLVKALNDDDTLILINSHMARAGFKKLQMGLNLYTKPLERAKAEQEKLSIRGAAPGSASAVETPLVATRDDMPLRATSDLRPTEPAPDETAIETATPAVESAPNPSETKGKKKRIYRGVVFYE